MCRNVKIKMVIKIGIVYSSLIITFNDLIPYKTCNNVTIEGDKSNIGFNLEHKNNIKERLRLI